MGVQLWSSPSPQGVIGTTKLAALSIEEALSSGSVAMKWAMDRRRYACSSALDSSSIPRTDVRVVAEVCQRSTSSDGTHQIKGMSVEGNLKPFFLSDATIGSKPLYCSAARRLNRAPFLGSLFFKHLSTSVCECPVVIETK
jgi:hypothetical protein